MKSILMPIDDFASAEARLQLALDVARVFDAHLTLLAASPFTSALPIEPYGSMFGGSYGYTALRDAVDEAQTALEKRIEARMANEDIRWDYVRVVDEPGRAILSWGAVADLIVMSPPAGARETGDPGLAGRVLVGSHTPVLFAPAHQHLFTPAAPAVVGWNGSFESANALRSAVPLLARASSVTLLAVDEASGGDTPSLDAAEYLSRHGIASEVRTVASGGRPPALVLREVAGELSAGLLVMGAYGHSRAREYWFGGTTRALLGNITCPTLMAH